MPRMCAVGQDLKTSFASSGAIGTSLGGPAINSGVATPGAKRVIGGRRRNDTLLGGGGGSSGPGGNQPPGGGPGIQQQY